MILRVLTDANNNLDSARRDSNDTSCIRPRAAHFWSRKTRTSWSMHSDS